MEKIDKVLEPPSLKLFHFSAYFVIVDKGFTFLEYSVNMFKGFFDCSKNTL